MKMNKIISLGCLLACASAIIDVASSVPTEANMRASRSQVRVSNSQGLSDALAAQETDIVLDAGAYPAPADGNGFQVTAAGTHITGAAGFTSVINCGGSKTAFGFDIQNNAVITGISVQLCSTGIQVSAGNVTFDSVSITNNFNNIGRGSGIHIMYGSTVTVTNSNISDNNGYGGIYSYGTLHVSDSTIARNIGTGVTTRYSSVFNCTNTQIVSNYGSGAFVSENAYLYSFVCNISDNYGAYTGGGIGAFNGHIYVVNSIIKDNNARIGGGIYFAGNLANYYVVDTEISGNTADSGYPEIYNPGVPCQGPSGSPVGSLPCGQ